MAKLIITEDGQDKIYEIAHESFTIGSGDNADCYVADPSTSAIHLDVKRTRQGYKIVDCETASGSRVNGKSVNEHVLTNGDTIEIGDTKITYIGAERANRRRGAARAAQSTASRSSATDTLERRSRQNTSWDRNMTSGARATVAVAITVVVLGVLYWALSNTGEPIDEFQTAAKNLEYRLNEHGMERIDKLRAELVELKGLAEGTEERRRVQRIEGLLKAKEVKDVNIGRGSEADVSFRRLSNYRKRNPTSFLRIREMCDEYLKNYDDLDRPNERLVRKIIANLEGKKQTPDELVLSKIIDDADVLLRQKEFRKAMAVIRGAPSNITAMYIEELEKKATWIRKRSRQVLTVRKNDIRHALRLNDPVLANQLLDDLFDKLVLITIEDYLRAPDGGYSAPDHARLELETQKVLKKKLEQVKRERGL